MQRSGVSLLCSVYTGLLDAMRGLTASKVMVAKKKKKTFYNNLGLLDPPVAVKVK